MREHRPDLILNAAAYTAVDRAESEPEAAMAVNGVAPGLLAEHARASGAALVHFSTDYVFDGEKTTAWREEDPTAPLNTYGRTKLAGEKAIVAVGCPHLIFRTSWIYGPRGSNFFLTMRRLAKEKKKLKVVDDQFGAPTPARFVADAVARVLEMLMPDGRLDRGRFREATGLYHLSASGRTSWHGFAAEILKDMQGAAVLLPIPGAEYPSAARRPRNSVLDNTRVRERFGVSLPDWQTGLQECLRSLGTDEYRA